MVTEKQHSIVIAEFNAIPESGLEWQYPEDPQISLLLFRRQGRLYVYRDVCPHQGRQFGFGRPGESRRFLFDKQNRLMCPHHGAVFQVSDGVCVSGPCRGAGLTEVPVKIEDGVVTVRRQDLEITH